MANANASGPGKPQVVTEKRDAAEDGVVRNAAGQLVKRRTLQTKAGPVITEVIVHEADYEVGDAIDRTPRTLEK